MGNVLEVSIAVCLEQVIVNKIFHLRVLDSVHSSETILKLALIASALRTCSDNLRREYRSMEQATSKRSRVEEETWHLPNPTAAAPSPNSLIPALEFKARLGRRNETLTKPNKSDASDNPEMRSLYLAMYGGQEVVVKFTYKYSPIAHDALAARNHAPKLHACELVVGGQKMVVMDRLDGTRMFDAEDQSSAQGLR